MAKLEGNFWDDLDEGLMARGLDPYTAKAAANHCRSVFDAYVRRFREDVSVTRDVRAIFDRIFIGEADV